VPRISPHGHSGSDEKHLDKFEFSEANPLAHSLGACHVHAIANERRSEDNSWQLLSRRDLSPWWVAQRP